MAQAQLNGVNVHYQRFGGSGPELVMVHGLATNLAFWYLRIVPLLAREYRVTTYDLRGHGRSGMPPSGYTTADMAADLHALFEHLEIARAHLVGHSYGGAVALHFATRYPERLASLTLADARIRALQPTQRLEDWPHAEVWKQSLQELRVPVPLDDPEMGYRFLEVLAEVELQGKQWKHPQLAHFSPFAAGRSRGTAERWLQLLRTTTARRDFCALAGLTRRHIRGVRLPVLAVFGEYSNCLPSCRGLKRHLPDCRVVIVPRTGHFHPVVRPVFFGRKLRRFLGEVARHSPSTS